MRQLVLQMDEAALEPEGSATTSGEAGPGMTLAQLAKLFSVTPAAVLKTERKALAKLRIAVQREKAETRKPCPVGEIVQGLRSIILLLATTEVDQADDDKLLSRARTKLWLALDCMLKGGSTAEDPFVLLRTIRDNVLAHDSDLSRAVLPWIGSALADLARAQIGRSNGQSLPREPALPRATAQQV
ncbi:MAG: hypothetical protein HYT87_19815 [Nitrospirae bacterium]|nr:hypothetical protein [Nitrospirota bacterium]